ncbi:MAG: hypothetical protein IPF46_07140 [Saprospiraceae bacterium]|nr:hypothetical protein [Candidatus Vicinibacter affinis]
MKKKTTEDLVQLVFEKKACSVDDCTFYLVSAPTTTKSNLHKLIQSVFGFRNEKDSIFTLWGCDYL